jgi:hypothetical protein
MGVGSDLFLSASEARSARVRRRVPQMQGVIEVMRRVEPCSAVKPRPGWFCLVLAAAVASLISGRGSFAAESLTAEPIAFDREVMAVLSKAGCNAGTCHGNLNGKGGFFLSLRGQDPAADWRELVTSEDGRRINLIEPDRSLVLLKATAEVPHGGGRRFGRSDPEWAVLERWIREAAPAPRDQAPEVARLLVDPADAVVEGPRAGIPLLVTAEFTDGSTADVTRMAVYEPSDPLIKVTTGGVVEFERPALTTVTIRYLRGQAVARMAVVPPQAGNANTWHGPEPANLIDEAVWARLQQLGVSPAPPADDLVFLRRVSLDLLGMLPTPDEAKAFQADQASDKREQLVDRLLARSEWADVWAGIWSDLLRVEEKTLDAKGVEVVHAWIRQSFADGKPLDAFVREIVAARGSTYDVPPSNFWRAHREPIVRAETVAQVFLGARIGCAKCHNHPFDRWLQDEYHDWSAVFTGIDYEIVKNERKDDLDKHEFVGEQIVQVKDFEERKNPRTNSPATPRLLGEAGYPAGDRLEALAAWMTSPENRRFAQSQVNRIWFHCMGRGLVEPVDDLRDTNPASHPELLEQLTDHFIASGHDVRGLVRLICTSQTYALSSRHPEPGPLVDNEQLYAKAIVRRRSAERILDAQVAVLGASARFEGYDDGTRAGEVAGVERVRRKTADGDEFLRLFGKPERLLACECERSNEPTLSQALTLVGGPGLNERLESSSNRITQLLAADRSSEAIVEDLFWAALVRPPTAEERAAAVAAFAAAASPREAAEDLAWALVNAKELLFRN